KEIFGDVVSKVAQVMNKLPAGDPTDPRTVCGPLISNKQRERVEKYLAIASQQGGTFVVGGSRPDYPDKGFYIQPTLITGIGNDSVVSQQEIFGPVLVALQFDGEDQALSLADATDYGLSASVWSSDRDRAMNFAKRLRTGTVSVNGGIWYSPDVPFGGYKQSGIGREMGTMGFEEYLEAKSIAEPA
ncbi:MAG TPA: aldehyde dehydrogenase family protein, partial [Acidimicrobiales bacterium]|nr:aldehyde dehydrogenase family protein [Acidimicrobiales bacterium]